MGRDDPQFNLRLPYELKEKLKQRAKSNGRSLNSELVQIVTDAVSRPSKISGYRDDAERIADEQSELVKKMVFDTLKDLYKKVIQELNQGMAVYKRIRAVFVRKDDFVRTTTRKIKRHENPVPED